MTEEGRFHNTDDEQLADNENRVLELESKHDSLDLGFDDDLPVVYNIKLRSSDEPEVLSRS